MTVWKFIDNGDLADYTLIIPSVAVGNVGQLACDLLVSSLNMKKIASAYSIALIPVLGYDPYDLNSNNVASSCDIYKSDDSRIVVLQVRAPLIHKYSQSFLEDITDKFKTKNIKDVIILTSSHAYEKKHISTSPFRFVTNESCIYKNKIKTLDWIQHSLDEGRLKIYGSGFATMLYDICVENSLSCLILYKYCSEGDNIPDAYDMIYHLNQVLPLFNKQNDLQMQLVQPVSWKFLFGRPLPKEIFG